MNALSRPLRRRQTLEGLLHPTSIAVIGASPRPGAFGVVPGQDNGPVRRRLIDRPSCLRHGTAGDRTSPAAVGSAQPVATPGTITLQPLEERLEL